VFILEGSILGGFVGVILCVCVCGILGVDLCGYFGCFVEVVFSC